MGYVILLWYSLNLPYNYCKWIKALQTPFHLGFNENIYHEGKISELPDFDVCSLLDIWKRNSRYRGKRKNGDFKHKRKNNTVWTLANFSKILKSELFQMIKKSS